jgi:hypothetical protein
MSFLPTDRVMLQALRASKIRGVQLAIVVDNKDGEGNPGYRVKVKFPWLNEQETSFWARIAVPMGGSGRGTYVLPEIDDQVLVVFEHGDINRPIVVGSLWSKTQEPVEVNQSGKNNTKLIKSRAGHRIIFDDKEGAEKIVIVDQTKKNKIILDSVNKIVKIESDGDIEIKAKTNIILHSNALKVGTKEGITGKARSLLTHAQKTFGLKATGGITIGGGNTTINVSNAAATSVSGSGAGELGAAGSATARDQVQDQQHGGGDGAGGGGSGPTPVASSSSGSAGAGASGSMRGTDTNSEITVVLLDAAGAPVPNLALTVRTPDGELHQAELASNGAFRLGDIEPGTCFVTWTGLATPPAGELPLEAPEVVDAGGALGVTRALAAYGTYDIGTRTAPHVFQLRRRTARVLEIEQFSNGGAVVLPGQAPCVLRERASRVPGIDALRACLREARGLPLDRLRLIGHGDRAEERAKNVALLLTKDRDGWAAASKDSADASDVASILKWIDETRGYNSDPDRSPRAILNFKEGYNHQLDLDEDTETTRLVMTEEIDLPTWCAFFDVIARALWPSSPRPLAQPYLIVNDHTQTYPVKLAEIATGDANRYRELYPLNPGRQIPGDRGWYGPKVGDVIWLPRDWDRAKLREKHYDVFDNEPPSEPDPDAPLPFERAPAVVSCSYHHPVHPADKSPERRGAVRAVELVMLEPGDTPKICGAQDCDAGTCELYDPRDHTLVYVDPEPAPLFGTTFMYGVQTGMDQQWTENACFRVTSEDGASVQSYPLTLGVPMGSLRVFMLVGIVPRMRYRGEIVDDDLYVSLFPYTELARIRDPDDPENILPLPEPTPASNENEEPPLGSGVLRVRLHDRDQKPMSNVAFRLTLLGEVYTGVSEDGWVGAPMPPACPRTARLEWADPLGDDRFEYAADIVLACGEDAEDDVRVESMLNNLGYPESVDLETRVSAFQRNLGLTERGLTGSGQVPPLTRARIAELHAARVEG